MVPPPPSTTTTTTTTTTLDASSAETTTSSSPHIQPTSVHVHPLVLLSVVDHYTRVAKDTRRRVVGVLLGEVSSKGVVDVQNCFALPFEEDPKDATIWYLDHSYLEVMYGMFKKINAREQVIGWYSTGPTIRESDLDIHRLLSGFAHVACPTFLICDVTPNETGLPVRAFAAVDDVREDGTQAGRKIFMNVQTSVSASEAEEIGVEHLLRDVKDASISTLAEDVVGKVQALKGLGTRLAEIKAYMDLVVDGKLPVQHEVIGRIQDIFNLLPNTSVEEMARSFAHQSNDMQTLVYVSSMIRSVLSLHGLIDNKERIRAAKARGKEKKEEMDKKEKEEKDKKEKEKKDEKDEKEKEEKKDGDVTMS